MAIRQEHTAGDDAVRAETLCELLCGLLAAATGIDIEGEINGARAIAQLSKLVSIQMCAQRAGDVAKACLPQHGIVEQSLDENHLGTLLNQVPSIQATLGSREEAMGEGSSDAAAVEIDDASVLTAGEDDAPVESIVAV